MGGNLTQLLDRVAIAIRDRNLFRGYFNAATALGRLTAFCIAAAAPVLLAGYSLWQPELIGEFARNPAGARALGIALGLEVVGCCWLFYLLRVDY
jgi:Flp pilus assembly protein TadB